MRLHGRGLGKLLVEEGVVPEGCSNVELHIPAEGAAFVRCDVWLDTEGNLLGVKRAIDRFLQTETQLRPGKPINLSHPTEIEG